jgi:AMMECR1 domain-containing protein
MRASDVVSELGRLDRAALEAAAKAIARTAAENAALGEPPPRACEVLSAPEIPQEVRDALQRASAGVFVTAIRRGTVRACVGSIWPQCANLGEEIARAGAMVVSRDLRHPPITRNELADLEFAVSIVGRVERVDARETWDPRVYGVLVRAGGRTGVILPGEALTHAKQVSWAREEAGISSGERFELLRFQTIRLGSSLGRPK